jgi:conjugative relaxase-like TrwC/TraI family protein
MITSANVKDSGYSGHLREVAKAAEYYIGEKVPSEWLGKGAQIQGLTGEVKREDLERLMDGHVVDATGERDLGRMRDGVRVHRAGVDFTNSAPKSVSIEAVVFGNQDVLEAHRIANRAAMASLEKTFMSRINGRHVRTGNATIAAFEHVQSRAGDSQLHTHNFAANVTFATDGRAYSVEYRAAQRAQKSSSEVYRNTLERELFRRGLDTYRDNEGAPQLKGYTKEQLDAFSSRRDAIDRELEARGKTRATATAAEKQAIAYETRKDTHYVPERRSEAEMRLRAEAAAVGIKPAEKVSRGYYETLKPTAERGRNTTLKENDLQREEHTQTRAKPAGKEQDRKDSKGPTAKMLAKMEGIEGRRVKSGERPTLTDRERTDFRAARAWLDARSEKVVGYQAGPSEKAPRENGREQGSRANFKAAVDALRDGELAARALKSASGIGFGLLKHELSAADKRSMERVFNSTGDRFYVDARGNVYQDKLNASKNGQTKSLEGKGLLGEKEYIVLKNGTVLKRGGGIGGALQQKMARSLKSEGDGALDRAWNKFVDRTVGDKWQRVTGFEATRVKAEIAREEKGARNEVRGRLVEQIHKARQLMQEKPELALAATKSIEANGYELKGVQKATGVSRGELADKAKAEGDSRKSEGQSKQPQPRERSANPEVDRAYEQEARRMAVARRAAEITVQREAQAADAARQLGRGKRGGGKKIDGTVFRVIQPRTADYDTGSQLSASRDLEIRRGRSLSRDMRDEALWDARRKTGMGRNLYADHWHIAEKPMQLGQNMWDRVGDVAALLDKRYDAFSRMAGEAKGLWSGGGAWKAMSRGADSGILRSFAMELQNDHERALEAASSVRGHQTRFGMASSDSGYATTRQMPGAGSVADYSRMPAVPGSNFERVDSMAGVGVEDASAGRRASAAAVANLLREELGRVPERSSSSSSISLDRAMTQAQETGRGGGDGMER